MLFVTLFLTFTASLIPDIDVLSMFRSLIPDSADVLIFLSKVLKQITTENRVGESSMVSELGKLPFSHFLFTDRERSEIPHDAFEEGDEFPVIDFSAPNAASQLESAARDFGFFQLVNHGVDPATIQEMQKEARAFFALPPEHKELVKHSEGSRMGYGLGGYRPKNFWHEGLEFFDSPSFKRELFTKLWPDSCTQARNFSDAVDRFSNEVSALGFKLMEILATQLGAPPDAFSKHCSRGESFLRFNHYPPCPNPSLTFGLPPHHDKYVLTVLHQDSVGGLQIYRNNRWQGLRPRPNSLIINVGCSLQVMSNGAYTSMRHRVVTNQQTSRLSMVYPISPRREVVFGPCPEIISPSYPAKYRSLSLAELLESADKARAESIEKSYLGSFEIKA